MLFCIAWLNIIQNVTLEIRFITLLRVLKGGDNRLDDK